MICIAEVPIIPACIICIAEVIIIPACIKPSRLDTFNWDFQYWILTSWKTNLFHYKTVLWGSKLMYLLRYTSCTFKGLANSPERISYWVKKLLYSLSNTSYKFVLAKALYTEKWSAHLYLHAFEKLSINYNLCLGHKSITSVKGHVFDWIHSNSTWPSGNSSTKFWNKNYSILLHISNSG